jgi:hypothetical protein
MGAQLTFAGFKATSNQLNGFTSLQSPAALATVIQNLARG